MPFLPRRPGPSDRSAQPEQTGVSATPEVAHHGRRAARMTARGALLVAVIAGTSAFAVHAVENGATPATTGFASVAPTPDVRDLFASASRSDARTDVTSIQVDGETLPVSADAKTVAEALAAAGVTLGVDDEVSVPLAGAVPDGEPIVVSRVTYVERTERTETPYAVTEQPDGALAVGQRQVVSAGQPGVETVTTVARVVDGVEVGREEALRVATPAVDEVVRIGADAKSLARSMVAARGWSADQFACLDRLWTKESNWNPRAQNPSSGAYGIPQSLPGSKMGTVAPDWRTNPATQITWGLNYIADRYGSPCAAWSHSQAVNWY